MAASTIDYEVHSLHINVGNGDGAIHLLVEPGETTNTVHRAILVDGGKPTAVDQILKTIKYVEDTYAIVDPDGNPQVDDHSAATKKPAQLRFDGIVISRWAIDHSAGVLALINQQLKEDQPDPALQRKSSDQTKTLGPCSFMRYDASQNPKTNFYSAFWDGPTGSSTLAKSTKLPPPTPQIKISSPAPTGTPPAIPPAAPKFTVNTVNRAVDFVDSEDTTKKWSRVFNLVATSTELIGRELFTGIIGAAGTDATKVRNYAGVSNMLDALATVPYNNKTGGKMTGICCIGADGVIVSDGTEPEADTSHIAKTSSIALVAVVGGTVKHYFAGDSHYVDDVNAATWIASDSVPVMKLGYHGSVASAPVDLVSKLKPSHFICSVGPSLDQLHPRWELLVYLQAWAGRTDSAIKSPFFHTTSYPVFFTALPPDSTTTTKHLEFELFAFEDNPTDDAVTRFQAEVNKLDPALVERIQEHTKASANADGASKTRWLIDFLRNMWPSISYSIPEQHPIVGAAAGGVTVSQETQILFIMAQLTSSDAVISYINGSRKVVSTSKSPSPDPAHLTTFKGYPLPPAGARKTPWFIADENRLDSAPGGVVLQKSPFPFKIDATTEDTTVWKDKDDETPALNLTTFISDGAFPAGEKVGPAEAAPTDGQAKLYFIGVPAYAKTTDGSDTQVIVGADVNIHTFISGLGPGYIGAEGADGDLKINDIWGYYMSVNILKTSVTITSDSTTKQINKISMNCGMFADQTLSFSTDFNEVQFNNRIYNAVGAVIHNSDIAIPDTGVVVCGLDPAASLSGVTLKSLLETFRFEITEGSKLDTLVNKLGGLLKLNLLAVDPGHAADVNKDHLELSEVPAYRNAIWCFADTLFRFTVRLSFTIDTTDIGKISDFLNDHFGISGISAKVSAVTQNVRFEVEMTGTYHPAKDFGYQVKTESVLRTIFPIHLGSVDLVLCLEFSNSGYSIDIHSGGVNSLSDLFNAGAELTKNDSILSARDVLTEAGVFGALGEIPFPNNIWISRESAKTQYGLSFLVTFQGQKFGLSYDSSGIFTGALILPVATANNQKLLPDYSIDRDPENAGGPDPQPLLITSLFESTFSSPLPAGLPSQISEAWVEYTRFGADDTQVRVFGTITSTASASGSVPAINIQSVSVQASRRKKSKTDPAEVTAGVSTTIQLAGSDPTNTAILNASLNYESGDWIFHGRLESFQFSVLYSHFPPEVADAFDDVLGKFLVRFVDITYTYAKSDESGKPRAASSFFISGAIDFGGLELNLAYQYVSDKPSGGSGKTAGQVVQDAAKATDPHSDVVPPGKSVLAAPEGTSSTTWKFDAWLGAIPGTEGDSGATIGSVLDGIDSSISDLLPDFVKSTPIPSASETPPPISIEVATLGETGQPPTGLAFRAWLKLGDIAMTFIQKSERIKPASGKPPVQKPKRILRISVATLPTASKIPLVNELPQPFDTLEYMWVSAPAPGKDGKEDPGAGYTTKEVGELNADVLGDNYPKILTKALKSGDDKKTGNDATTKAAAGDEIVLLSGHHFRVIHNDEVILDYPFGKKQFPTPEPKGAPAVNANADTTTSTTSQAVAHVPKPQNKLDADPAPADGDAPVSKGKIGKTIGPLTISNVGVKLDDGFFWLTIDAELALGPISFDLIGFGIGFNLKKADKGLSVASIESLAASIQIQLHGLGLGFQRPPITIAGVFMHDDVGGVSSYSGGVAVGFPPYTLVAVGEYDEAHTATESYKSVFIFAKLDGPLIELEFATIEGVRLGFGFNNIVVTPDLDHLTSFPFISDSAYASAGGSNDPMKVLAAIQASIQLQNGALWLAAGMKITAFDVLSITAVALVEFSKAGCDISLFCDGMASMPPDAGPAQSIIYVEVVMVIELNVSQGFFRCEAALAPTSFILVPQCHLFGGFALCYWFPPSDYAGDFVFTIGGFNRFYTPPPHYPVPHRIGYACKMGDNLSVSGEAYFAITPTCCMGGGHYHVQIDVGPISAYLDAYADFLINYKPFHYIADLGVDVGVTFNADFWIIHIHISCHVGAHLHLEGPEFGGKADVDFYLFGFTVYFGASPKPPLALLLNSDLDANGKDIGPGGFYKICKLPGPAGTTPPPGQGPVSTADPEMTNLHVTLEDGAYTGGSAKTADSNDASNPATVPGTIWKVRAGAFRFRITCDFSISSYTINHETPKLARGPKDPNPPAEAAIFAFPMHNTVAIDSNLCVYIVKAEDLPNATIPQPTGTNPVLTDAQIAGIQGFNNQPFKSAFVIKPVPKALWQSYESPLNLLAGNTTVPTVDLAMGITVGAPSPKLSADKIDFAFNALEAMRANVFGEDIDDPPIDPTLPTQTSWAPHPVDHPSEPAGWDEVRGLWKSNTAELGAQLSLCMSALGWDQPPPEGKSVSVGGPMELWVEGDRKPWELNPGFPEVLKKKLESCYLALPQIAGAA